MGKKEISTDILVIGSGGAGLAAAVQARELGAKVLLIEKHAAFGGTTAQIEGMCGVGSHLQLEDGYDLTPGELLEKAMTYHHWIADPELTRRYFELSGETIAWLESHGVAFKGVIRQHDSCRTWHIFEGLGFQFVKTMAAEMEKMGVETMLKTPAKSLIIENGRAVGAVAEGADGTEYTIRAKAVILCSGGYADSEEMMKKYTGRDFSHIDPIGAGGRTGDGINMGLSAGADTSNIGTIMIAGGALKGKSMSSQLSTMAGRQPMLFVNEKGERFFNEGLVMNFSFTGNAMSRQKEFFNVMTWDQIRMFHDDGAIMGKGMYVPVGMKLTEVYDEIDAEIKKGNPDVIVADTLDELADKMGVARENLLRTVASYNEYCWTGVDTQFRKPKEYLYPIEEGPYYAFHLSKAYYCTVGGLRVDLDCRVVSKQDEEPIVGLYACGCDAGGIYGDSYDVGVAAGSQGGWAVNSGRIAAMHAAANL